jgi:SAM-dependent methyltransferase
MERVTKDLESIQISYGKRPKEHEKEFTELLHYESGQADIDASQVTGPFSEPWLNVINTHEPASMPAFDQVLRIDYLREKIRGKVLDVGAGTCWLTAKTSLLPTVDQVFALDLSENFMRTTGVRILQHFNAELGKITFVISDFNEIPLDDASLDCAFLFATFHHSLSPIKTLQEVGRCLKKNGVLMILENPCSVIKIRKGRKQALELSKSVTEMAYTKGELEYMIESANIGKVQSFPFDILSGRGLKMAVRKVFRYLGVEAVLINPPTYLFVVEKN